MCLYPRLVTNPKFKENKKNGGIIPLCYDRRQRLVPIGCGKCMECMKRKAGDWKIRLTEEIKEWKRGEKHFVTLTFSNENLETLKKEIPNLTGYDLDNAVATLAMRRYLERWRKKHTKSVKHWFVTELGKTNTERIHIHGIMFTKELKDIKEIWKYGMAWVGTYVNEATVGYIVKYIFKTDQQHKDYKPIILTSAGIGASYMKTGNSKRHYYVENETRDYYIHRNGTKQALPIYYRNKIYTEEERELLWSEKLDQEERWVDGRKIKINYGIEEYIGARNEARRKNQRLGYGKLQTTEGDKKYKTQLKEIIKITKDETINRTKAEYATPDRQRP